MNSNTHYLLVKKKVYRVSFDVWVRLFEHITRKIAVDTLDNARVSTVFLGIDHQYIDGLPPILFETMVFGGILDNWQWRYMTYREAEIGHSRVVKALRLRSRLKRRNARH